MINTNENTATVSTGQTTLVVCRGQRTEIRYLGKNLPRRLHQEMILILISCEAAAFRKQQQQKTNKRTEQ